MCDRWLGYQINHAHLKSTHTSFNTVWKHLAWPELGIHLLRQTLKDESTMAKISTAYSFNRDVPWTKET